MPVAVLFVLFQTTYAETLKKYILARLNPLHPDNLGPLPGITTKVQLSPGSPEAAVP